MTRLERKEAELKRLYGYKRHFMEQNDILSMHRTQEKINQIEKEVEEIKRYEPQRLGDLLADRDESVKNGIYKALLRISLLADVVNEAAEEARSILRKLGIDDFAFRQKVTELCKLSQEIACVPLIQKGSLLEDFIVDNEKFVNMCMKHADAHIKRKLKL